MRIVTGWGREESGRGTPHFLEILKFLEKMLRNGRDGGGKGRGGGGSSWGFGVYGSGVEFLIGSWRFGGLEGRPLHGEGGGGGQYLVF